MQMAECGCNNLSHKQTQEYAHIKLVTFVKTHLYFIFKVPVLTETEFFSLQN